MKIIVIGASGIIGKAVVKELESRHEVLAVGHQQGDYQVDITEQSSIATLFKTIGKVDGIILTTGKVHFAELSEMNDATYAIGLKDKLMGQVNTVLIGQSYLRDGGSFTLTSGVLSHDPISQGSSASMVNGALDAFVKSAAIELPRGLRINCVSPSVITEALDSYGPYFRGFKSVDAAHVALAYSKSVEGKQTGQVYRVY